MTHPIVLRLEAARARQESQPVPPRPDSSRHGWIRGIIYVILATLLLWIFMLGRLGLLVIESFNDLPQYRRTEIVVAIAVLAYTAFIIRLAWPPDDD